MKWILLDAWKTYINNNAFRDEMNVMRFRHIYLVYIVNFIQSMRCGFSMEKVIQVNEDK